MLAVGSTDVEANSASSAVISDASAMRSSTEVMEFSESEHHDAHGLKGNSLSCGGVKFKYVAFLGGVIAFIVVMIVIIFNA